MTALTVPARPENDASPRPVPWRRMAWVTWRQHRIAVAGVAALLGAWAVYLWLAGLQVHHAYAAVTPAIRQARLLAGKSSAGSISPMAIRRWQPRSCCRWCPR